MSDRQAAEGPAFWSPAAGRGSAGGVGDRRGVEGSPAASSGTQRPGRWKGWVPLGSGPRTSGDPCPHRHGDHGCARGHFLPRFEMSWFPSRFLSQTSRVGSPPLLPLLHLVGVSRGARSQPRFAPRSPPAPAFGSPGDPTSVPRLSLSACSCRRLPGRPPSSVRAPLCPSLRGA